MSLFNDRLKELRNERSLTQEQLANKLDIPSATIRRLEVSNSIPRRDRLVLLANFFNVSTDYLLGETDDKTPSKKRTVKKKIKEITTTLIPITLSQKKTKKTSGRTLNACLLIWNQTRH